MKVTVNEKSEIILKEVYNSIVLESDAGEELSICMRDSGFEFLYGHEMYEAKNGNLHKMPIIEKLSEMPSYVEEMADNESLRLRNIEVSPKVIMKFKDAPIGARFRYPGMETVFVKINSFPKGQFSDGRGLVVQWNGNVQGFQSHCCFTGGEYDFDTEIELI